jgi:endoglucanase
VTRGISLGGLFETTPPGAWLHERHFAAVAEAGLTTVRLPVKWSAHADAAPPYAIDPGFLAAVDRAVAGGRAHGLAVVVDIHHYDELSADPDGHAERFLALWRQLAPRYPADVRLELLNEPHDRLRGARWNALLAQALAVVRDAAPEHTVIAGPAHRNVIAGLDELEPPPDDHLIVGVHYYLPFEFTHQGAAWLPGAGAWLGREWDGEAAVIADLERVAAWGRAHGHEMSIGEFGVLDTVPMPARAAWTACVRRTAERLGLSWCYWDFATDFGAYDLGAGAWRAPLYEALSSPAS